MESERPATLGTPDALTRHQPAKRLAHSRATRATKAAINSAEWLAEGYAAIGAVIGAVAGVSAAQKISRGDSSSWSDAADGLKSLRQKLKLPKLGGAGEVGPPKNRDF